MEAEVDVTLSKYYVTDARAAACVVRALTRDHYIEAQNLNSSIPYVDKLAGLCGLGGDELSDDRHAAAGIFNIAFHTAKAAIAISSEYKKYAASTLSSLHAFQEPRIVYERSVQGLCLAFELPTEVAQDVLGPLNECSFALMATANVFPHVAWKTRPRVDHGTSLWRSLYDIGHSLDDALIAHAPSFSNLAHGSGDRRRLRKDVQEGYEKDTAETHAGVIHDSDEDAEGSTDDECTQLRVDHSITEVDRQSRISLSGQSMEGGEGALKRNLSEFEPQSRRRGSFSDIEERSMKRRRRASYSAES